MAGTHIVSGSAVGVVIGTGDRSVFGRLAKLTSAPKTGLTSLEKEIYYFVGIIVTIMITMVVIVIAVWAGWLRRDHPERDVHHLPPQREPAMSARGTMPAHATRPSFARRPLRLTGDGSAPRERRDTSRTKKGPHPVEAGEGLRSRLRESNP